MPSIKYLGLTIYEKKLYLESYDRINLAVVWNVIVNLAFGVTIYLECLLKGILCDLFHLHT